MTILEAAPIIRDKVSSAAIVAHYGYKPDRGGYICCPFHKEKTASLKVHKSGWYCYGCHLGGDAISFVKEHERCKFGEAVRMIDDWFGLGLVKAEKVTLAEISAKRTREKRERDRQTLIEAAKRAVEAFLEAEWHTSFVLYKDAYSTPTASRTAIQWFAMAVEEDNLQHIDYLMERARAADSIDDLSGILALFERSQVPTEVRRRYAAGTS